jgi:hypothetical protein
MEQHDDLDLALSVEAMDCGATQRVVLNRPDASLVLVFFSLTSPRSMHV